MKHSHLELSTLSCLMEMMPRRPGGVRGHQTSLSSERAQGAKSVNRITEALSAVNSRGRRRRANGWTGSLLAGAILAGGCRGLGAAGESKPIHGPHTAQKVDGQSAADPAEATIQKVSFGTAFGRHRLRPNWRA